MKEITSLFSASKCPLLRSPLTAPSKLIFTVIVLSVFACLLCRISVQFRSVAQSCLPLCHPMGCSTPGFPVHHQLQELSHTYVHRASDPTLFPPLLFLPSVFPSIRVFSNDSALPIRWPNYGSFSFSISPSNEYSGLISFRMD